MSGYTPIFSTMLEGTLYGRWPHTGIWACLLSQMSREGVIDKTPQCLASAIGVPVDVLTACINDFMQPDLDSRTPDNDGRRLELIDPTRSWGWRVLNAQKYREKARKKTYDADRTASGADAERKRQEREKEGAKENVPTPPAKSRRGPLSDSNSDNKSQITPPRAARTSRLPDDFVLTSERKLVAEAETLPADRTFAKFCDYWRSVGGAKARKIDWDATWRNWCRIEHDRNPKKATEAQKWT